MSKEFMDFLNQSSEVDIFSLFFDGCSLRLQFHKKQFVLHGRSGNETFRPMEDDLKIFIGILLFSRYVQVPYHRMYWKMVETVSILLCQPLYRETSLKSC